MSSELFNLTSLTPLTSGAGAPNHTNHQSSRKQITVKAVTGAFKLTSKQGILI